MTPFPTPDAAGIEAAFAADALLQKFLLDLKAHNDKENAYTTGLRNANAADIKEANELRKARRKITLRINNLNSMIAQRRARIKLPSSTGKRIIRFITNRKMTIQHRVLRQAKQEFANEYTSQWYKALTASNPTLPQAGMANSTQHSQGVPTGEVGQPGSD